MELNLFEHNMSVCRVDSLEGIDFGQLFVFVSKTDEEISLVCETASVPENAAMREDGWRMLKITGVLDFGMVGVIAKISRILADEQVSLFVVSTYNTDYILIKSDRLATAIRALERHGYLIIA